MKGKSVKNLTQGSWRVKPVRRNAMTDVKRRKSQQDHGGDDDKSDRASGVLLINKKTPFHFVRFVVYYKTVLSKKQSGFR